MDIQDIRNPSLSYQVLTKIGITRARFTVLNSTVKEMVEAFAGKLLSPRILEDISNNKQATRKEELSNTYLYVYTDKSYKMFLQMISKERIYAKGSLTYTEDCSVIYSGQENVDLDSCPIFSESDVNIFDNIEVTPYGRMFDSKHVHLVRVSTVESSFGGLSSSIVEYNLFVPDSL